MKTGPSRAVSRHHTNPDPVKAPAAAPPENHSPAMSLFQIAAWIDVRSPVRIAPPAPVVDGNTFATLRLEVENQNARPSRPPGRLTAPVRVDRQLC